MSGQAVVPAKLANALAERLSRVVPPEVRIAPAGTSIRLRIRGTPWGSEADLRWPLEEAEDGSLCFAVEHVLGGFQDDIAEIVGEPWPATAPAPMPEPYAEIRDGELVAGYGDVRQPELRLLPIRLDELT